MKSLNLEIKKISLAIDGDEHRIFTLEKEDKYNISIYNEAYTEHKNNGKKNCSRNLIYEI